MIILHARLVKSVEKPDQLLEVLLYKLVELVVLAKVSMKLLSTVNLHVQNVTTLVLLVPEELIIIV